MAAWRRYDTERAALLALGLGLLVAAYAVYDIGRGGTFYVDEWNVVVSRTGHAPSVFLEPYNGHAAIFPIFIYKGLLEVFGLDQYQAFRAVHILAMELLAALVYFYGRPRVGRWWALFGSLAIAIGGGAAEYALQTFQVTFTLSLLGVIGALLAIDRGRDRLAAALLSVAVLSSGLGVSLLPAVIVEVAMRDDRRRRWWVAGIPLALYVLWWIPYHVSQIKSDAFTHVPRYVEGEYAAGVAALTTFGPLNGAMALALLVAAVLAAVGRTGARPRFWFALVAPVGFWVITALTRYGISEPDTSRYAYVSALLLVLLILELGAGRRLPAVSGRLMLVGAVALAALVVNNAGLLDDQRFGRFSESTRLLQPKLGALEQARGVVDPSFEPEVTLAPKMTAGEYFAALDRYSGSPAADLEEIALAKSDARAGADAVLLAALRVAVEPIRSVPAGCDPVTGDIGLGAGDSLVIDNRRGAAPAAVRLWRFAHPPGQTLTTPVAPGEVGQVSVPEGAQPGAYPLTAAVDGAGFSACTVPSNG